MFTSKGKLADQLANVLLLISCMTQERRKQFNESFPVIASMGSYCWKDINYFCPIGKVVPKLGKAARLEVRKKSDFYYLSILYLPSEEQAQYDNGLESDLWHKNLFVHTDVNRVLDMLSAVCFTLFINPKYVSNWETINKLVYLFSGGKDYDV